MIHLPAHIATVADFPSAGIQFRDITPLLAHPEAFATICELMAAHAKAQKADTLVAVESRGFIFATPMALLLKLPVVLVRKPGKLPREVVEVAYELEYGKDRLQVHKDDIQAGKRYTIVDDVLATGGTASATAQLIEQAGGTVAGFCFLMELDGLSGREKLADYSIAQLMNFPA